MQSPRRRSVKLGQRRHRCYVHSRWVPDALQAIGSSTAVLYGWRLVAPQEEKERKQNPNTPKNNFSMFFFLLCNLSFSFLFFLLTMRCFLNTKFACYRYIMVIWKEREHEVLDNQAANDPTTIEALWNCGLLNYFWIPGMKEHIWLLEYIKDMWDPN